MQNARNNVLAGVFVLMGVVLAVWVSFLLSDRSPFDSVMPLSVRFPVETGAVGLKRGSEVRLGGQPVGRVLDVGFARDDQGTPTSVDVRVEVRDDLMLYANTRVYLEKPLLGSISAINISSVGTPTNPASGAPVPRLAPGDVIPGATAPPGFLADAGFGPEQSAQLRAAIKSIDETMQRVASIVENTGPKVESGATDAAALLAELRVKLDEWTVRIDATAANVERASARLDPLLEKADLGLDDARGVIASVRSLIEDNRARIDQTVKNLEEATGKFNQETIDAVNVALRDGRDALGVFSEAVGRVSAVVGEQTPNLRRTLANLRLMSDQLKLTAIEVRSQPWRLLQQPSTKELESQVIYDATRSYAEAASDLRAAGEALEAAAAAQRAGAATAADFEALSASLAESIARYRQAEQYLLDKLVEVQVGK
ncbi:MAG: hypothetical protein SFY69_01380 [Planctomycetota bacterium]|nr:hypothetical protein [Planctomycetota bacterium]